MKKYFKAERYLNSLLNLSIVKKVPLNSLRDIGGKSEEDYLRDEGVSDEYIKKGVALDRMKALMDKLGNPEKGHKILHIAGTSGKGSVAIIAHEILRRSHLRTGLYTSPHLTLVMERIKTGDYFIPAEEFIRYLKVVKMANDNLYEAGNVGSPSYHETIFATALLYLKSENPDISVIETGLGWKNDYTKIIPSSSVSIITNISFDHTDYLGDTLESITENKSDIISDESICVTGCDNPPLLKIIEDKASEKRAELKIMGRDFKVYPERDTGKGYIFSYESKYGRYRELELSLPGRHQVTNAAMAISAAEEVLRLYGRKRDEAIIRGVLKNIKLPGRLEVVSKNPTVIIDGAHNPAKMKVLREALSEKFSYDKLIVVLGAIEGKDIKVMLREIVPLSHMVIATLPRVAGRVSVSPRQVAGEVRELGGNALVILDPFEAFDYAQSIAAKTDLICITGSLYLAGELRTCWVSEEYIIKTRKNSLP